MSDGGSTVSGVAETAPGRMRSDARANLDALLEAAREVFAEAGVDAPVRAIADRAHVGVATLYRRFPRRSDLISAVFRREVEACVAAADGFERTLPPGEALDAWIMRYTRFVAAKLGLAAALHSGDPAYEPLAQAFSTRLAPTCGRLLDAARAAGAIRQEIEPEELLSAVSRLCSGERDGPGGGMRSERMVRLLLAGLAASDADVATTGAAGAAGEQEEHG